MNTNDTRLVSSGFARVAEPGIYALLAAILIGPLLFLDGFMTGREAAMALVGAAFGLLASCAAAPVTCLIGSLRRQPASWIVQTAEILPFIRRRSSTTDQRPDHERRAA